jgi:SSS family solute:Na+ symporter
VTVLIWIYGPFTIGGDPLSAVIYEIIPGFIVASVAAIAVTKMCEPVSNKITERHEAFTKLLVEKAD